MLSNRGLFRRNSVDRCAMASKLQEVASISRNEVKKIIGQHLLAEFRVPENFNITPESLRKVVYKAVISSGATPLRELFFHTASGGISGGVVIEESHFIAHYFPADNYLALDLYTCGEKINTHQALEHIQESLNLIPYDMMSFKRGVLAGPSSVIKPGIASMKNDTLRFFKENKGLEVKAEKQSIATHWVGELYYSDGAIINDAETILKAFETEEMHVIKDRHSYTHNFEPQGATVVVIGDGFHITTHPWPEFDYTPVDLFVSSRINLDPETIMKKLVDDSFRSKKYNLYCFPRGVYNEEKELQPNFQQRPQPKFECVFNGLLPEAECSVIGLRR